MQRVTDALSGIDHPEDPRVALVVGEDSRMYDILGKTRLKSAPMRVPSNPEAIQAFLEAPGAHFARTDDEA